MNDIDRQIRLESDAVRESNIRHTKNREYQLATDLKPARDLVGNCLNSDSKPVRDVLGHCLKPPADVIRAEQLKLQTISGIKP